MGFRSLFRLSPPSMFGLPEEGHTVIPSGPQEILGDVVHAPTGIHVGYGATSVYRPVTQAVTESLSIRSLDCELRDNVLTVHVDTESHAEAYAIARSAVGRFTSQLSLDTGRYCDAEALFVEGGDGHWRPPRLMLLSRVAGYDIVELRAQLREAAAACSIDDERLVVGCRYLQHARWLFDLTAVSTDPDDVNTRMLASSIFLNLYKVR